MKALSLTQPWATAIIEGVKQWETRSWPTRYRGPLAIHAAKAFPGWAYGFYVNDCWEIAGKVLVRGAVIGTCELVDCLPTEKAITMISKQEEKYGDYGEGRFAFRLENVKKLPEPVPFKGALGLWEYPEAK